MDSLAGVEPIGEITSIEGERTESAGSVKCRSGRMDVRVVAESRRLVDIEAQLYPEDIGARSAFYAAQLIVANTPKGTKFKDVPQAAVINRLDDKALLPEADGFVGVCRMHWEVDGKPAGSILEGAQVDNIVFVLVELETAERIASRLHDLGIEASVIEQAVAE